jgi:high affinity Mn2+ porin
MRGGVFREFVAAASCWTTILLVPPPSAMAADLPAKPSARPALVWSWTGVYFGGHIGEGFGQLRASGDPVAAPFAQVPGASLQGLIGGYQVGYNYQFNNGIVVGAEADVTFGSLSGLSHQLNPDYRSAFERFGTVRLRAGQAYGRFLPYVTGGLAWGRNRIATDGPVGDDQHVIRAHWGWTVGLGVEYAVDEHWSMRGEALYIAFNSRNYGELFFGDAGAAAAPFTPNVTEFRWGLNYRWGDGAKTNAAPAKGMIVKAPVLSDRDDWSIHAQTTFIEQGYPSFRSPYTGENSLFGGSQARNTWTVTAYVGRKLWDGGEIFFNPELTQGFGLSDTRGLGGFPNGEAQKSGFPLPHPNVARFFLRQTFGLGGEQEKVEDDLNSIAGKRDVSRVTLTAGKLAVTDFFDDNTYSHDPRTTFLNWSIWGSGAYDYPADTVGYTYGGVAELNQKSWALRAGYFAMPRVSNVNQFDGEFPNHGGAVVELETRYALFSQPGKLRLLGFLNRDYSGSYRETLDNPALNLDITQTRRTREKYGYAVNVEQAITSELGAFARWSWNDGKNEIMAFTDIDASLSGGAVLKGAKWGRPDDKIGVGGAINGLSVDHRDFIAAGGLGPLIGDGRLNYQTERIIEAFYAVSLYKDVALTFDYQFIVNPAYNADRGPVSIYAVRLRGQY